MKKTNCYKSIIKVLTQLNTSHPTFTFGRHISTALSDYGDSWDLTDKEILFALNKYATELSIDSSFIDDEYINKIVKDGCNLDTILDEDEDEEDEE